MSMQDFWHRQGQNGTWSGYYDGAADLKTYNFFTRREAVLELLRRDGAYPRILDVGCGTGDYVEVAQQHDGSFFGIDYAHGMIRQAAERIPGHGQRHLFVVGSGEHLPYADGSFDLVMAMGYIEYFRDPAVPMRELRRVLKSGGTLVLQSFKKDLFGELDRLVFNPLETVMRRLLRRRRHVPDLGLPPDWYDKKYSQRQLDALVRPFGFERSGFVFNNFHVFPAFWLLRRPRRYIDLSERIQRSNPSRWRHLAVNYIAKYVLHKADDETNRPMTREGVA